MPKVSLNAELNSSGQVVQKGPATDYSMLLQMKRRQVIVSEALTRASVNGRKGDGIVVDDQHTRGFTDNAVTPVFIAKGARIGFFKW